MRQLLLDFHVMLRKKHFVNEVAITAKVSVMADPRGGRPGLLGPVAMRL